MFTEKEIKDWGKRASPLERDIEAKVSAYAKTLGAHSRKWSSPSSVSVPDRLFFFPGPLLLVIEFKRKDKKATPAQMKEMACLTDRGFAVFVIDNVADGKQLIRDYHAISQSMVEYL